jgi:hypothetical protein
MTALADKGPIDEILSCFEKIKTIELAEESLPNESILEWHESLKIREKRERLRSEIIQLRGVLKDKMYGT